MKGPINTRLVYDNLERGSITSQRSLYVLHYVGYVDNEQYPQYSDCIRPSPVRSERMPVGDTILIHFQSLTFTVHVFVYRSSRRWSACRLPKMVRSLLTVRETDSCCLCVGVSKLWLVRVAHIETDSIRSLCLFCRVRVCVQSETDMMAMSHRVGWADRSCSSRWRLCNKANEWFIAMCNDVSAELVCKVTY